MNSEKKIIFSIKAFITQEGKFLALHKNLFQLK